MEAAQKDSGAPGKVGLWINKKVGLKKKKIIIPSDSDLMVKKI